MNSTTFLEAYPYDVELKMPTYWFERVDFWATRLWVYERRLTSVYIAVAYVLLVFLGRAWMKSRQPFDLRRPLFLWNLGLAIFSVAGAVRTVPSVIEVLKQPNGFYRSVCVRDGLTEPLAFWALLFTLSKVVELGDTVFIILRKTPLIFLHWYHHSSMVIHLFFLYPEAEPISRWPGVLNYCVHSVMYSYYALKALRFNLPKKMSMVITSLQLIQFITVLIANFYTLLILAMGGECARSPLGIRMQIIGGISYLLLFCNFFYQTYLKKRKGQKQA